LRHRERPFGRGDGVTTTQNISTCQNLAALFRVGPLPSGRHLSPVIRSSLARAGPTGLTESNAAWTHTGPATLGPLGQRYTPRPQCCVLPLATPSTSGNSARTSEIGDRVHGLPGNLTLTAEGSGFAAVIFCPIRGLTGKGCVPAIRSSWHLGSIEACEPLNDLSGFSCLDRGAGCLQCPGRSGRPQNAESCRPLAGGR